MRVTATAETPSYVVLDDFYHRGWTARVDGQPARVLIANALFRAVAIEPGTHTIEFRFEPLSLLLGEVVSALGLLAVLISIAWGLNETFENIAAGSARAPAGSGREAKRCAACSGSAFRQGVVLSSSCRQVVKVLARGSHDRKTR